MDTVHGRNKEVPDNLAEIIRNQVGLQEVLAALRNRALTSNLTPTQPVSGAANKIIGAKLIAKASGMFFGYVAVNNTGATAGDVIGYGVQAFTDATPGVPLTFGSATLSGPGTNGIARPGPVQVTDNGVYGSSANTGITLTNANAGVTVSGAGKTVTIGTLAVGDQYVWAGLIQNGLSTSQELTFAPGTTCAITVFVTNSVTGRPLGNCQIGLIELP